MKMVRAFITHLPAFEISNFSLSKFDRIQNFLSQNAFFVQKFAFFLQYKNSIISCICFTMAINFLLIFKLKIRIENDFIYSNALFGCNFTFKYNFSNRKSFFKNYIKLTTFLLNKKSPVRTTEDF